MSPHHFRAAVSASALLAALALAGCGGPSGGAPTADGGPPVASPAPTVTVTVTASPSPSSAPLAGTCTGSDGPAPRTPVIFEALSGDAVTPITLTYTTFDVDGGVGTATETVTGPVAYRIGYACTTAAGGSDWSVTATIGASGFIACVLSYGGQIVARDSRFGEGEAPPPARCTGNPGR